MEKSLVAMIRECSRFQNWVIDTTVENALQILSKLNDIPDVEKIRWKSTYVQNANLYIINGWFKHKDRYQIFDIWAKN